ncbi:hypothetical protein SUDANB6_05632 [Streptomyces sp. enrichment culture]
MGEAGAGRTTEAAKSWRIRPRAPSPGAFGGRLAPSGSRPPNGREQPLDWRTPESVSAFAVAVARGGLCDIIRP